MYFNIIIRFIFSKFKIILNLILLLLFIYFFWQKWRAPRGPKSFFLKQPNTKKNVQGCDCGLFGFAFFGVVDAAAQFAGLCANFKLADGCGPQPNHRFAQRLARAWRVCSL